jgi:hypothetical protein
MVKQRTIQLPAIATNNTNKSGEAASKPALAKMLGNVSFVHKVVVFIVPSNLSCNCSSSGV